MIDKLTCCLAHPMTALRTLKDKLNEVINGHNALVKKVDNLPTGGGGGGGSGTPAPGPVVVLPETSLLFDEGAGYFMIPDGLPEIPRPGASLSVYYNGVPYECLMERVYATGENYGFGNLGAMSMGQGTPDAPFVCMIIVSDGVSMAMLVPFDGAESVTLKIDKTADPAPASLFRVNGTYDYTSHTVISVDSNYWAIKTAYDKGDIPYCAMNYSSAQYTIFHLREINTDMAIFTANVAGNTTTDLLFNSSGEMEMVHYNF